MFCAAKVVASELMASNCRGLERNAPPVTLRPGSPVNHILGYAQVRQEEAVTSTVEDLLARVGRRIDRMIVYCHIIAEVQVYGVIIGNLVVSIPYRTVQHRTCLISKGW